MNAPNICLCLAASNARRPGRLLSALRSAIGATWVVAGVLMTANSYAAGARDDLWKAVDDAAGRGLPQTALERLEPIVRGALQDRAWAEAAKAIARKAAYEGMIQGNRPEERIVRLEAELARAPAELRPILDTILAHGYWQYFQQNRWRFLQRTASVEAPGTDLTTWDLKRIFAQIDQTFARALAAAPALQRIPIAAYDALLPQGELPDRYRPTLFDFIACQALEFYTSGEQAGALAEDAFELAADTPALDGEAQFLAWDLSALQRRYPDAPALKAAAIYQQLLRFHAGDADPTARADADLARIHWAGRVAVGDDTAARYQAALKTFLDRWADHEVAAVALHHWAVSLQAQDDLAGAHRLVARGYQIHPQSPGGALCHNLLKELEAPGLQITTEAVWSATPPRIEVRYRNLTNVWFKAIAIDWLDLAEERVKWPHTMGQAEREAFVRRPAALEWSHALTPASNFKEHRAEFVAPVQLPLGHYYLVASARPDFGGSSNQVSLSEVWISNLAIITRGRGGAMGAFVLDADTGEPVAGATVQPWVHGNDATLRRLTPSTTDTNGHCRLETPRPVHGFVQATHGGRQLVVPLEMLWSQIPVDRARNFSLLFTDRALYRPGQIIQFKGICVRVNAEKDDYQLLPNREVRVVFWDANQQEIARQRLKVNAFGSFAGSFTAPQGRLAGALRIAAEGDVPGQAEVQVEEYKRPKFQVQLESPATAARLKERVRVDGKATAYTGAPIDQATVRYRVARQVQFPPWWGWRWRHRPQLGESQEIAHGTARTDANGAFHIEFTARPDASVPAKDEPTFQFEVSVDITDSAGETRSSQRTIRVGYAALEARIEAEDWQTARTPVRLTLHTETLDGQPQAIEGTVRIHRLVEPAQVQRPPLENPRGGQFRIDPTTGNLLPPADDEVDLSNPDAWEPGAVVWEQPCSTGTNGIAELAHSLATGAYRVVLATRDRFDQAVSARRTILVLDPTAERLAMPVPHLLTAARWTVQPGETFEALWGTGYDQGRAFVEIEHRHRLIERYWTAPGRTQQPIRKTVTEALRGGFTVHLTRVRENRAYLDSREVDVPWSNKDFTVTWEHFTSKLEPGQKETWTAVIQPTRPEAAAGGAALPALAEMVATLYDASLDQFYGHHWPARFGFFRQTPSTIQTRFGNQPAWFEHFLGGFERSVLPVHLGYRTLPDDLVGRFGGNLERMRGRYARYALAAPTTAMAPQPAPASVELRSSFDAAESVLSQGKGALPGAVGLAGEPGGSAPARPRIDTAQVSARKNLQETAFFLPQLLSDSNGVVRLEFTLPEALTEWRFLGFAHDRQLRSGLLEGRAVAARELMVQPNPPRFLREGDELEFTVKVSNQSKTPQTGRVRLNFTEAPSGAAVDRTLGNRTPEQSFDLPAGRSHSYAWRVKVPDGLGVLTFKAVASTGTLSDGEAGFLPVLSRRVFVTESLPLPIRGPATKQFRFAKLLESGRSKTLQHESVTVQMVSNPAWYAVLALPYLMEFPHECTEQTFNRLYANALARHLANSQPRIRAVFDQWKNTPALDSPLEKNQDLKAVLLEESPWVRRAQDESAGRRNVGVLFDDARLTAETRGILQKLAQAQLADGAWPWFPGGRANDYITLYITTGFGRLRHLGVDLETQPAIRALARLDAWLDGIYREILKNGRQDDYHLSPTIALYLYGRSFFLKDRPLTGAPKEAVDYFLAQARRYWLQTENRQTQGHLALALKRFGDAQTAAGIVRSLLERSVNDPELGRYWRDTEASWWWYRAPIESQALMIEAFDEVAGDTRAVEDCKVWLVKQKQTQDWKTTKATADAVYALLLRGADLLVSQALVEVEVGGVNLTPGARPTAAPAPPATPEPGTGFYERRFAGTQVEPKLGEIRVRKADAGVAWGSMHWQYLEDIRQVTPHTNTPLRLSKAVFTKQHTASGPVLEPVRGALQVGDELVVRIELRVDRDLEYVHLKDQRGSGTEPVAVLSGYRYQDGLGYYESPRDTATHFFIDYLPKGTYVFEYATRVQHRGEYPTGLAEIQCMYAPEFNSHSASIPLTVR